MLIPSTRRLHRLPTRIPWRHRRFLPMHTLIARTGNGYRPSSGGAYLCISPDHDCFGVMGTACWSFGVMWGNVRILLLVRVVKCQE